MEWIEQWKVFVKEWMDNQPIQDVGEIKGKLKPNFYDFMEWLSKKF